MQAKAARKNSKKVIKVKIAAPSLDSLNDYIDKTIIVLLCIFATYLPLAFIPIASEPANLGKIFTLYFFTVLLFALFVFKTILNKKQNVKKNPLSFIVILFLIAQVVAAIFSPSIITSLVGTYGSWDNSVITNICYTIIFLVASSTVDFKKHWSYIKYSLYLGSMLTNLIGFGTLLFLPRSSGVINGVPLSTFTSIESYSYITVLVSMIAVSDILEQAKWGNKVPAFITIVLATVNMYLTAKVSNFVAVALALLITSILFLWSLRKHKKELFKALIKLEIVFVVFTGIFVICLLNKDLRSDVTTYSFSSFRTISAVIKGLVSSPIIGLGPQVSYRETLKYLPQDSRAQTANPETNLYNNFYIETLASTGILGVGVLIIMLYIYFKSVTQEQKSTEHIGLILCINTYFCLLLFSSQTVVLSAISWLMLGIYFGSIFSTKATKPVISNSLFARQTGEFQKRLIPASLISILILIILLNQTINFLLGELKYNTSLRNQDLQAKVIAIEQAKKYNPLEPVYYKYSAYLYYEYSKQATTSEDTIRLSQEAIKNGLSAHDINPVSIKNNEFLGTLYYNLAGFINEDENIKNAIYYYSKALHIDPENEEIEKKIQISKEANNK